MPDRYDTEGTSADLAVVGLGPGGLAAALRAAQMGKRVVAFTNRSEYVRGQRLLIDKTTAAFLKSLIDPKDPEDRRFWTRYQAEKVIQTKDIERFLYRKLSSLPNVSIVQLDASCSIQSVGKGEARKASYIQLSNGDKYYCRNIVAADGAKHGFADLMNRDLGAGITYRRSAVQERHEYHAAVQLRVKPGEKPSRIIPQSFVKRMLFYVRCGWEASYQPRHYILPNKNKTKFSFAGEIPRRIYEERDEATRDELLKEWVGEAIFREYGYRPDQLEYRVSKKESKNRLKATAFKMEMTECEKPVVPLCGDGFFVQIGDARRTPNYTLGHGLNDAIALGISFAHGLSSSQRSTILIYSRMAALKDSVIVRSMRSREEDGEEIKLDSLLELSATIDRLADRLRRDPDKYRGHIARLEAARDTIRGSANVDPTHALYTIAEELAPIVAQHKNTGILYQIWRGFLSIFDARATMTTSARLLDDIDKTMEFYASRPSR